MSYPNAWPSLRQKYYLILILYFKMYLPILPFIIFESSISLSFFSLSYAPTLLVLQNYKKSSLSNRRCTLFSLQITNSSQKPFGKRAILWKEDYKIIFFPPEMIRVFPTNQKVLKQAQWCLYLGRMEQPGWGILFTCIQALGAVLHF